MHKGRTTIRQGGMLGDHRTKFVGTWRFDVKSSTTMARLEDAYLTGLDVVDRAEKRVRDSKTSNRFTDEGVIDDVRGFIMSDLVGPLRRARNAIDHARGELSERKSKLQLEGPDRMDMAAAMRRQEIRQRLREMQPDKQSEYFARYGQKIPADVLHAVTEMPPEFSGVPASRHELLVERALGERFGDELAELSELEEAITTAERTVNASREELMAESKIFDQGRFNEMAAPGEAKFAAPWLRQDGSGNVCVVDLESGVLRRATPEETQAGVFYRNHEEFIQGKAA